MNGNMLSFYKPVRSNSRGRTLLFWEALFPVSGIRYPYIFKDKQQMFKAATVTWDELS